MKKPSYVAIDIGTSSTLISVDGMIVYNEPSIVAYRMSDKKIIAVGKEAYQMIGKNNKSLRVQQTMTDGVISDISATTRQLEYVINKLRIHELLKKSIMLLACPSYVTSLERQALEKIAIKLGAEFVIIQEEVKMAALGGGVNINASYGNLVVDSGGGTTDIAVVSSGDIVLSKSIKIAGNYIDKEIQKYVRSQHGMDIGIKTAEDIKMKIGSLVKVTETQKVYAYGRDVVSGLPRQALISPEELREVIKVPVSRLIDLTVQVLEETPAELAGDIFKRGITLTGGNSLLSGMAKYFADTLQLPARIGEQPLLAVINGAKKYESKVMEIYREIGSSTSHFVE